MPKTSKNRSSVSITASFGRAAIRVEISLTWLLAAATIAFRLYNLFAGLPR